MTPDCFVCPLTSLRGAVVNQALHVGDKQKGGERRREREREAGPCLSSTRGAKRGGGIVVGGSRGVKKNKKGSKKVPLYIRFVASRRWGASEGETKTHVHMQTWQRLKG